MAQNSAITIELEVSIPDRVLWVFRLAGIVAEVSQLKFQSLIGFYGFSGGVFNSLFVSVGNYVSIPDRVLWVFRRKAAVLGTKISSVSIPDRVLWVFRPDERRNYRCTHSVSIPDRVLWVFRPIGWECICPIADVSIPDRVLWVFRQEERSRCCDCTLWSGFNP